MGVVLATPDRTVAPAAADELDATDAPEVARAFVEMLCADDDFVRAEFEALMAVEFPPLRPGDSIRAVPAREGSNPDRHPYLDNPSRPGSERHGGAGGWSRQRSPPQV